jgi:ribonuclease HI
MPKITIYTDGGCSNNKKGLGLGGWAYIILNEDQEPIECNGAENNTTNNRMELKSVIEGLKATPISSEIDLYSDSAYVVNCFKDKWYTKWRKNGWINSAKKPVENKDLWEILLQLVEARNVTFCKVKGHADNKWNNRCDQLAKIRL